MPCYSPRRTVLLLLLLCVSCGLLLSSAGLRNAPRSVAVMGEAGADAAAEEAENLPPLAYLPLLDLRIQFHCHAIVPEDQVQIVEWLLIDDHAARGPPATA